MKDLDSLWHSHNVMFLHIDFWYYGAAHGMLLIWAVLWLLRLLLSSYYFLYISVWERYSGKLIAE